MDSNEKGMNEVKIQQQITYWGDNWNLVFMITMINISFKLVTYARIHLFQQCGQTYVFVLMKFVWKNRENVPQGLCDSHAENISTSYNQNIYKNVW